MQIFWRYLSRDYLKVFLLSTFGFISILLITRLKEIAKFAALTPNLGKVLLYTIFQIPHILPVAIPISSLISSFLLFNRYSRTAELTALRVSGLSIKKIISPIITISIFISFLTFFITSEITPYCWIHAKKIAHEDITLNPIMLLERQEFLKIKNSYIDLQVSNNKNIAKDIFFITTNKSSGRLNLIIAKKMELQNDSLIGNNISIISYFPSENQGAFDHLVVENQENMTTQASNLSKYMKSNSFYLNPLYLPTKMLLVRNQVESKNEKSSFSPSLEIIRRGTLSFSAFSFTFIGICFGIDISRTGSRKKIIQASLSALLLLLTFTIGKGLKYYPFYAGAFYILPQFFILLFSSRNLYKISRGIE
jgi:lipopolysaccharide export system permease protein